MGGLLDSASQEAHAHRRSAPPLARAERRELMRAIAERAGHRGSEIKDCSAREASEGGGSS